MLPIDIHKEMPVLHEGLITIYGHQKSEQDHELAPMVCGRDLYRALEEKQEFWPWLHGLVKEISLDIDYANPGFIPYLKTVNSDADSYGGGVLDGFVQDIMVSLYQARRITYHTSGEGKGKVYKYFVSLARTSPFQG